MAIWDSLLESYVKCKLAVTAKKREESFAILEIFKKNNPRVSVDGNYVFPFYYVVVNYSDGRTVLSLCESDIVGFKLQKEFESLSGVKTVSWPEKVGIHLTDPNVMSSYTE